MIKLSKPRLELLSSFVTRSLSAIVILLAFGCSYAYANVNCQGTLTQAQRIGFELMFSPPYSMSLVNTGVGSINLSKRLTAAQLQSLRKTPAPAATNTLSDTHARLLRKSLNENATDSVPSWVSTAIGIAAPVAWLGLGADVLSQAVSGSGDAGRLLLANLAGTVTQGGKVGVLEQVANDRSGRPKFMASYVYTAQINDKKVITLLAICTADIVMDDSITKYPDCPAGGSEYCYCAYEKNLEDLKQYVNDRESMRQRVTEVKKTLDLCISRSGK